MKTIKNKGCIMPSSWDPIDPNNTKTKPKRPSYNSVPAEYKIFVVYYFSLFINSIMINFCFYYPSLIMVYIMGGIYLIFGFYLFKHQITYKYRMADLTNFVVDGNKYKKFENYTHSIFLAVLITYSFNMYNFFTKNHDPIFNILLIYLVGLIIFNLCIQLYLVYFLNNHFNKTRKKDF